MAGRFQLWIPCLIRTHRVRRLLLGAVVVAAGGQLNVAEQQVNVAEGGTSDEG